MRHITISREKDIRKIWPTIIKGLDIIMGKSPEYKDWKPVNVMGELMGNQNGCKLYIVEEDDQYAGFVVARYFRDEFTLEPVCFIWLAYLKEQGLIEDVYSWMMMEAKRHRCKRIRIQSNRPGWKKIAERLGGKLWYSTYQKEL